MIMTRESMTGENTVGFAMNNGAPISCLLFYLPFLLLLKGLCSEW